MFERLTLDPPKHRQELLRLRARIEINRAVTLRRCSAVKAAHASAQRAIQDSQDDPGLQAEAYMVLASLLSHGGLSVLAMDAVSRAIDLAKNANEKILGQAWTQRGDILFRCGDFEEARTSFLQAIPLARRARDHYNLVKLEGNVGACLFDLKRYDQARKRFVKAIDLARKYDDPAAEAFWLVELGRLALAEGKLDDADQQAHAALRIAKPKEHLLTTFRAEWLRHLVVRERDPKKADRHRLAYLRKLYLRVKEHRTLNAVTEFEDLVLTASTSQETP